MMNFYDLLGVDRNASSLQIKQAYRQMVKKYHPDINKSEEASKIIVSLNEAKNILLDEVKRRDYDRKLFELENSKQFSKDKTETYSTKSKEYKETYSESYVTRWEFYKNYIKFAKDKMFVKFIKSFLVGLDFIFFSIFKLLTSLLVFLIVVFGEFTYYFSGLLILIGVFGLVKVIDYNNFSYIPFLPSNVEFCIFYSSLGIMIEIFKILILKKSINIYVLLQKIQDKIMIFVLMK